MKPTLFISLIMLPMLGAADNSPGQTAVTDHVIGTGGAATQGDNVRILSTLGQPTIGPASSKTRFYGIGFWYRIGPAEALTTSIETLDSGRGDIPDKYQLHSNYPNPFNPSTAIRFDLPEQARVRLLIFDLLGRVVATLVDAEFEAGVYRTVWNARDEAGRRVASGLYIYRLETANFSQSRSMLLLK